MVSCILVCSMLGRILVTVGVISMAILLYMVNATTPSEAGALGVLTVFLVLYIVSAVLLTFFIYWTNRIIVRVFFADSSVRYLDRLSLKRSYYYGSILALGPVMLISLQSVGRGGIGAFALVGILLAIGLVYVSRQTS